MIIPTLLALGVGGAGGWAIARAQKERDRRSRARRRGLPPPDDGPRPTPPSPLPQETYRAPDPAAVINVPVDAEDFDQMAEAFCVCFAALEQDRGRMPTVAELRDCFLSAIYPDFSWPPVPGDPASAQLMWMIADHEARKLLADPSACNGGGAA